VTTLGEILPNVGLFIHSESSGAIIEASKRAKKPVYYFDTPAQLEAMLTVTEHNSRVVVIESLKADGIVNPIDVYKGITHRLGGLFVLDEIRAVGVYGETGAGLLDLCERSDGEDTLVIGSVDGTLGGLMMGGYVVGKSDHIDAIRSFASSFIFTTALPPAVIQCASICIDEVRGNNQGRALLMEKARMVSTRLAEVGVPLLETSSHILCIPLASPQEAKKAAGALARNGVLLEPLLSPGSTEGTIGLRLNPTTAHTEEMTETLVTALQTVSKELKLW